MPVEWVEGLGITIRDARRYCNFPAQAALERQYTRYGYGSTRGWRGFQDRLPVTLSEARNTVAKMAECVDTVPLDELARIERVAGAMKYLFWDAIDVRGVATDVSQRARARLRQPQERLTTPFRHYRDAAE